MDGLCSVLSCLAGWFRRVSQKQKSPVGFLADGLFLDLVAGEDLSFLSRGVGFASLRAPDDRLKSAGHHSKIQKSPHEAGSFEFGCGDRI